MKAVVVKTYGGPEVLEFIETADPAAGNREVVIEVHSASINFADIKARSGAYHLGRKPPYVPGIDLAGVVRELGPGVESLKVGDRVIAFPASGSYAERAIASEDLCYVIDRSISFSAAAAAPIVAGTSTHMLSRICGLKRGETVLVHCAAGGVGSTAVRIAGLLGASLVLGSTASRWKEGFVMERGAAAVIDYRARNYSEDVKRLTGGSGVDVILSPLGGATVEQDIASLAPFGRLVVFGALAGEAGAISSSKLSNVNKSIAGFSFGHCRKFRPQQVRRTMEQVIKMLAEGSLDIEPADSRPLREAAAGHRALERREVTGKIVLIP